MLGDLWKALQSKKEMLVAAFRKVPGNSERIFAHSILASPGVAVKVFFASPYALESSKLTILPSPLNICL